MSDLERGDALVTILAERRESTATDVEDLLQLLRRGFPAHRLRRLLESDDVAVVRTGTALLAELGEQLTSAATLLPELLAHDDPKVRYYAVQAVLGAGSAHHGRLAATAADLVQDPSGPVRRSAARFLAFAPEAQLSAMLPFVSDTRRHELLSRLMAGPSADAIAAHLQAEPVDRLVAAAAAVRLARRDPGPLHDAAASEDDDVRELARVELEVIEARRRGRP